MRSFAELVILSLTGAVPLGAQAPRAAAPDSAITAAVATAIAARWSVEPERLVLVWGVVPSHLPPGIAPSFRLAGGAQGWFAVIFESAGRLPVAAQVRAALRDTVLVASRAMERGAQLGVADIQAVEREVFSPDARRTQAAPGWILRLAVAAGTPLTDRVASPPAAVRARDRVRLVWTVGGARVSTDGTVLHDAPLGASVLVRDPHGRSGLRGIVASASEITMTP